MGSMTVGSWVDSSSSLKSEVEVFNRWGQLLFRSQPGTTWWDGTFNGALLPASDYYYVITVFPGAAPITGTVTLKY